MNAGIMKDAPEIIRLKDFSLKNEIIKLLNESFQGFWGDGKYFDWKFADSKKHTLSSNYWVIERDNQIAGCYGYVPVGINIKGKQYTVGEAADGAVKNEFRRCGLFQSLMEKTFEDVTREGIVFSYAIGTPTSKQTFFKCGWTTWINLEKFTIKFSAGSALKRFVLRFFKFILTFYIFLSDLFDNRKVQCSASDEMPAEEDLDCLYRNYSAGLDVIFNRDPEYIKWRLSNPNSKYRYIAIYEDENLCGIFIINNIENERIYVVEDYAYTDISHLKKMLRVMIKDAVKNKIAKLKIEFNTRSKINIGFLKNFFSKKLIVNYLIKNGSLDSGLFDLVMNTDKIHVTRFDKNE